MNEQGYQRVSHGPAKDAVAWWYVRTFDDGYVYARGGWVETTRIARKTLRDQFAMSANAHQRILDMPLLYLHGDGSVSKVEYGPYGAVRT